MGKQGLCARRSALRTFTSPSAPSSSRSFLDIPPPNGMSAKRSFISIGSARVLRTPPFACRDVVLFHLKWGNAPRDSHMAAAERRGNP